MNKKLLLLPLMVALTGCEFQIGSLHIGGKKNSGSNSNSDSNQQQEQQQQQEEQKITPKEIAADFIIGYDDLKDHFVEGKTYPGAPYSFTAGGIEFDATGGVGLKSANDEGQGNYYNENHILQFRSASNANGGGVISVGEPVIASKIVVHWVATYSSEESQYHPVVYVGEKADKVETKVSNNEGNNISGTERSGAKEYSSGEDRKVYGYTTSYNIPSGKYFFAISAPNYAMYVEDIVICK